MLEGYERGIGLGGWLTNFKRIAVLPPEWRMRLTPGDFEHFETYITREDIRRIAGWGLDHIRMPFDQLVVEDFDRPGHYREEGLRHLDNVIDWCRHEGLNIILNCHKAFGMYCDLGVQTELLTNAEYQERFCAMWRMLDTRYAGLDMPFELMNEISMPDNALWNQVAPKLIGGIRAEAPARKLIIGGANYNSADCLMDLRLYDDPNISYTFHFYEPFAFTHQRGILQQKPAIYNRAMRYPDDMAPYLAYLNFFGDVTADYDRFERMDRRFIEWKLRPVLNFQQRHPGKELYFGEFGTIRHADIRSRENWMRDVIGFAVRNGIPYCSWNYLSCPYDGNRFSLTDDDRRLPLSGELPCILRGEPVLNP